MDAVRDDVLADARLAEEEDAEVAPCRELDELVDPLHLRVAAADSSRGRAWELGSVGPAEDDEDRADLDQAARTDDARLAGGEALALDEGAVGAPEVLDPDLAARPSHREPGMPPRDRGVVDAHARSSPRPISSWPVSGRSRTTDPPGQIATRRGRAASAASAKLGQLIGGRSANLFAEIVLAVCGSEADKASFRAVMPLAASTDEVLIGRYFLFREIAAGGMASIHLARQLGPVGFGRTVAVKRLHPHYAREPGFVAMFVDEARIVTSIRHPNVVPVLDVVAVPGHLLLVMEYVHGEPVSKLTAAAHERGEAVPPTIVAAIGIGLLDGLHAAHEARGQGGAPLEVIHRDVSPQNLLVGADGMVRVLDFGIAKARSQVHETTAGSGVKGKLKYMAPEQVDGRPVDRRVDIWAAGVILWELLTGEPLFNGDNDGVVIHRLLSMEIRPPSTVRGSPPAFDAVVMKALARVVDERWLDAGSMAIALETACRPASARETSAWVERLCGDELRQRDAIVHELEVVANSGLPSIRTQLAFITDQTGAAPVAPTSRALAPASDEATVFAGGRVAATRLSDMGPSPVAATVTPGVRSTRKVAVVFLLFAVIGAAVMLALRSRVVPVPPDVATTTSLAMMAASARPAASPSPPPSASVIPSASPSVPVPVRRAPPRGRPPAGPDDGVRLDHRK